MHYQGNFFSAILLSINEFLLTTLNTHKNSIDIILYNIYYFLDPLFFLMLLLVVFPGLFEIFFFPLAAPAAFLPPLSPLPPLPNLPAGASLNPLPPFPPFFARPGSFLRNSERSAAFSPFCFISSFHLLIASRFLLFSLCFSRVLTV